MDVTLSVPSPPVYDPKAAEHMLERRIAAAEQDAAVVIAFYGRLIATDFVVDGDSAAAWRLDRDAVLALTVAWLRRTL